MTQWGFKYSKDASINSSLNKPEVQAYLVVAYRDGGCLRLNVETLKSK